VVLSSAAKQSRGHSPRGTPASRAISANTLAPPSPGQARAVSTSISATSSFKGAQFVLQPITAMSNSATSAASGR
jgi:hypothetical protein